MSSGNNTSLIVGLGRMGGEIAPALASFHTVMAYDPHASLPEDVQKVDTLKAALRGKSRLFVPIIAGIGSAAIAHAAVKTRHPASEGYVALIEPFIDTIVICAATALVIITTGVWDDGYGDIAMTSAAFGTVSSWFPWVLAGAVCLFAFSTILAAGYYSLQVIDYFFRHSLLTRRIYLGFFCGLLPIGAIVDVTTVTNLIDSLFFMLSVPNLIGVYLMRNVVSREASDFRQSLNSYR